MMRQLRTLMWKEWRRTRPLFLALLIGFVVFILLKFA